MVIYTDNPLFVALGAGPELEAGAGEPLGEVQAAPQRGGVGHG
jgi:hypothetical protein